MAKIKTNSADNSLSPHATKKFQYGGIADMKVSDNGGGFRPSADTTQLGTMNTIMSDTYNKK